MPRWPSVRLGRATAGQPSEPARPSPVRTKDPPPRPRVDVKNGARVWRHPRRMKGCTGIHFTNGPWPLERES